jgi:hypothetical protein
MKKRVSSLENNKLLFYVVVAISVLNLIVFLNVQDWNSVIFFALAGFVGYSFKLDNTTSLIIALVAANIFRASKRLREGLENAENDETVKDDEDKENPVQPKPKPKTKDVKPTVSPLPPINTDTSKPKITPENQPKPAEAFTSAAQGKNSHKNASELSEGTLSNTTLEGLTSTANNLMDRQDQLHKLAKQLGPLMTQASKMMKQLPDGFLRDALKKKR